jgi:hypothetical protein
MAERRAQAMRSRTKARPTEGEVRLIMAALDVLSGNAWPDWEGYERDKRELRKLNPQPDEYEREIKLIAERRNV